MKAHCWDANSQREFKNRILKEFYSLALNRHAIILNFLTAKPNT